jgi:SAM-dependent methyltransferase
MPHGVNDRMMQMITGYWVTQIIHAVATYSLADHLKGGPLTAAEIARIERTDESATFRLLSACASLGLLTNDGGSQFAATPLLDTLRSDNPQSLRDLALMLPAPGHWQPWGRFVNSIKTGQPQTYSAFGVPFFEYLTKNPIEAEAFTRVMTSDTAVVSQEVARTVDTRSVTVVADIGGAAGALLHALLHANNALQGIVFDRPSVVKCAATAASKAGLQNRLTIVGGDFFESVPSADLYLLKYVLHDWGDDDAIRILQNCRRALRPGGRVAVIEQLLGNVGAPAFAPLMDLTMMVVLTGRERNLLEYQQLFETAGLRLTERFPTKTPVTILEAMAA